jgi:hypothetical protein
MDYFYNAAWLGALGDFLQRIDATKQIGVIALPGDRLNEVDDEETSHRLGEE